jgi:flagellar biosynthesis protein FlhG
MSLSTSEFSFANAAAKVKGRNIITISSGKGGVGKTWLAATLSHALARSGRRVLLFDGDLGLANVDVQLGFSPEHDLGGVFAGSYRLCDAIEPLADTGFDIISGRSGSGSLASIHASRLTALRDDLVALSGDYDDVIVDLGAGVEHSVRLLTVSTGRCLVVCTDEPTALTDAYAFIKLTHKETPETDLRVVVNMAPSASDGNRVYDTLNKVCQNFLSMSPPLAGIVRRDAHVRDTIRYQTAMLARHPTSPAATDVEKLASDLLAEG